MSSRKGFFRHYLSKAALPTSFFLLLFGCGEVDNGGSKTSPVSLTLKIPSLKTLSRENSPANAPVPATVASVGLRVTAPDLSPIVSVFDVSPGTTVTKNFDIPSGGGRLFEARAFSGSQGTGTPLYQGKRTVDLAPGIDTPVVILMSDIKAPLISSHTPLAGATEVAVNTAITVIFNEPMDPNSFNASSFSLTDASGTAVTGAGAYNPTPPTATFTPSAPLTGATTYTVNISGGVTDSGGNALAPFSWSFTTDSIAPSVLSKSPADGSGGVAVNSSITATFDEAVNPSSLTTTTFQVAALVGFPPSPSPIAGTVAYNTANQTATFTPSASLDNSVTHNVTLSGVTDVAGNAMTAPVTWKFNSFTAGVADTTFNGTGYVTHHNAAGGADNDEGKAVIVDSQGKIVVTGNSIRFSTEKDMALWRYKADGTLDSANFNATNGFIAYDEGVFGDDGGFDVVEDSSGNLYVVGEIWSSTTNLDMAIWRYNSSGVLDTTGFNSPNGYLTHTGAAGGSNAVDRGGAVALDGNGNIVVAGESFNGTDADMVVWRYTPSGILDPSFGVGGIAIHANAAGGNSNDVGHAIAIDGNGRIVVAGASTGSTVGMALWRFDSSGNLDTSFNGVGYTVHQNAAGGADGIDSSSGVIVDSSGRIVVSGYSHNGTNLDMVLWRYNSNGTLDNTFGGGNGFVVYAHGGNGDDKAYAIARDLNGNILAAGKIWNGVSFDMALWRYDSTGNPDTTFGTSGSIFHDSGGANDDYANGVTVDTSGNIIVTGVRTGTLWDMAIWSFK